jgi:hypothetical protein
VCNNQQHNARADRDLKNPQHIVDRAHPEESPEEWMVRQNILKAEYAAEQESKDHAADAAGDESIAAQEEDDSFAK